MKTRNARHLRYQKAFTLLEIFAVVAVITTLAGLSFSAAGAARKYAARQRAKAEISAIQLALKAFETDNGFLPAATDISILNSGTTNACYESDTQSPTYRAASSVLFLALMGRSTWEEAATGKVYLNFGEDQVFTEGALKDPWGNPYGYYYDPATRSSLHHAAGYDLWSTGNSRKWITNWD
ncbi:MAG: hypothetical protein V1746_01820 [bacterium]